MIPLEDCGFGVIIPAAGRGERMRGREFKIFAGLGSGTVLGLTLRAFLDLDFIRRIVIAAPPACVGRVRNEVVPPVPSVPVTVVAGGARRQDSVTAAFQCLGDCAYVIIHDAVRPLVTPAEIRRAAAAAVECGAALPGVVPRATIKVCAADGTVTATPERAGLREAQTPQVFRADIFRAGLAVVAERGLEVTDDARVAELAGAVVRVVEGSYRNIKITTPEDLALARLLLAEESAA